MKNNSQLLAKLILLVAWVSSAASANNEDVTDEEQDYSGGTIRLGVFAINNIQARVYAGPADIPLRAVIDLNKDLGIKDSVTAFRANLLYRFSKHHAVGLGYYKLGLDGKVGLSRTIEFNETEFDIGIDVRTKYEEQITKLAYNWIFHDEGRVMLSVSPGIHFSKVRVSIESLGTGIIGGIGLGEREYASVAAPLPMLGGRLAYRLTDKWSIVAASDIFFLNRGSQEGQLTDSHIFAEYRSSDRFSLGGGLNRFSLDLQLADDGVSWDWSSVYTGAYLYLGIHF